MRIKAAIKEVAITRLLQIAGKFSKPQLFELSNLIQIPIEFIHLSIKSNDILRMLKNPMCELIRCIDVELLKLTIANRDQIPLRVMELLDA